MKRMKIAARAARSSSSVDSSDEPNVTSKVLMVKDVAVQDEDVLMLFENGDSGGQFGEDSDDEATVDSPLLAPGSMADFMLGSTASAMLRTANLHPSEWFVAFCNDKFRDHLPQSS